MNYVYRYLKIYVAKHSKTNNNWNNAEQCRFDVYSKQIINDLKRFDIGPRKSLTYNFPEWLVNHPLVHHYYKNLLLQKCNLKSISEPKNNNGIGQFCFKGQEDVKNIIRFIYKDSTIFLERKYNIAKGFIL